MTRLFRVLRTAFTTWTGLIAIVAIAAGLAVDEQGPTFASFLTPGGAIVAAGLVTALIEVIKAAIPSLDARVSGALLAFALTALLYVFTGLAVGTPNPDAVLNVFLSWLTCATSAIGIKSAGTHIAAVKAGVAGAPPTGDETGGTP